MATQTETQTELKLRYRPCTHLLHRPSVKGDKDIAGVQVPKGHTCIVRIGDCHIENGVIDPAGVEAVALKYMSPTLMTGSLNGKLECVFEIKGDPRRVYRASLSAGQKPGDSLSKTVKKVEDRKSVV